MEHYVYSVVTSKDGKQEEELVWKRKPWNIWSPSEESSSPWKSSKAGRAGPGTGGHG